MQTVTFRVVKWKYASTDMPDVLYDVIDDWEAQMFWAPILGPSAFMLLRQLAIDLDTLADEIHVDVDTYALGIGIRDADWVRKAMNRLMSFGVAHSDGLRVYIRTELGIPATRHRRCWPPSVSEFYAERFPDAS
jgi:hypothetical protein